MQLFEEVYKKNYKEVLMEQTTKTVKSELKESDVKEKFEISQSNGVHVQRIVVKQTSRKPSLRCKPVGGGSP
jgi:hypothetical protein